MKVSELLESRTLLELKSGAWHKPGYNKESKTLMGSVKDWLDTVGVTKQELEKAMAQVRGLPLFRNDLPAAGLKYAPSPGKEGRGTFNFEVTRRFTPSNGKAYSYKGGFQVHANGQIRGSGAAQFGGGENIHKLVSPKPRMIPGDNVRSLVKTYTAALEELLSKWKKSVTKMNKTVIEKKPSFDDKLAERNKSWSGISKKD